MPVDLIPCPFCGCAVEIEHYHDDEGTSVCNIGCDNVACEIKPRTQTVFSRYESEVVKQWNQRAELEAVKTSANSASRAIALPPLEDIEKRVCASLRAGGQYDSVDCFIIQRTRTIILEMLTEQQHAHAEICDHVWAWVTGDLQRCERCGWIRQG